MKYILSLILTFFLFASSITPVSAAQNFTITSDTTYSIKENGNTDVAFAISLTNTTSQYYASSYTIQIGFDDINNLKVSDPNGPITPRVVDTDKGKNIEIEFNKRVVGLGNTLPFTLSFQTHQVAQKRGTIWDINIPGLLNGDEFSTFNVHVKVPPVFGNPTYIKPSFITFFQGQQITNLDFTKDQLQKSGVSISYGSEQIFDFKLLYHLKNNNVFPIKTEIALPPSTNYQTVFINSIEPQPANVVVDQDGNWLAQFSLAPSKRQDIEVKGKAKLLLFPSREEITNEYLSKYLVSNTYWETQDTHIQELAKRLKTPQAIYEYVVSTLSYDFSRVTQEKPRLGAAQVLSHPNSAVCLEFTDLFVALARAAGIPAREIDGFAFTQNSRQRPLSLVKDVLHAWPEYYDKDQKAWVMVDPTWGNTTGGVDYYSILDFDHFAFVIKGIDSSYPVPAGGYKLSGLENVQDVHVNYSEENPITLQKFDIDNRVPSHSFSALPITGSVTIKNVGNIALDKQIVTISSRFVTPRNQNIPFTQIPPFGYQTQTFYLDKTPFLTNKKDLVTIRVGEKTFLYTVTISPIIITLYTILGGGIFAASIIISVITYRSWRLRIQRQNG